MTPQELKDILRQGENSSIALKFHYDTVPVVGASLNDLNHSALDSYFSGYDIEFSKEVESARIALLTNTDILAVSGEPTIGGMLMFGVNPGRYLPQSGIMFAHFNGNDPDDELIDRQEINGTLPQQVDAALAVIKNNLLRPSIIEGSSTTNLSITCKNGLRHGTIFSHRDR